MSGSVARLVLRAQGRLPVVEPLLPSRYAAGPQAGFSEEIGIETAAAQASSSPGEPVMPVVRTAPISAPPSPPTPRPPVGGRPETITETSDASPLAESRMTTPDSVPRPPASMERTAAEPLATRRMTPPELARAAARPQSPNRLDVPSSLTVPATVAEHVPHNPGRRPPPGVPPLLSREAALAVTRPARTETPRLETSSASAPDVHISIGRVEVHAAPARPAPLRAAPVRQSALSLADYLARRR